MRQVTDTDLLPNANAITKSVEIEILKIKIMPVPPEKSGLECAVWNESDEPLGCVSEVPVQP